MSLVDAEDLNTSPLIYLIAKILCENGAIWTPPSESCQPPGISDHQPSRPDLHGGPGAAGDDQRSDRSEGSIMPRKNSAPLPGMRDFAPEAAS